MIKNIFRHLRTVTKHRNAVAKNCFRAGIPMRGLLHDLSKFSPEEFFESAKHYQGTRSPNAAEKEEKGYSTAWLHHKGRNKHHFEYWIDFEQKPNYKLVGHPMPKKYVVEMFLDRMAACKIYKGKEYTDSSALEYFNKNKDHYVMHETTFNLLEELLIMLSEKGEKVTFAYIREKVLK